MKFLFDIAELCQQKLKIVSCFFLLCILSSCASRSGSEFDYARAMRHMHRFEEKLVKGGRFWITTYQKITDITKPYVFYIEGDGRIVMNRYQLSDNPTPRYKTLSELASLDPRPNVIYVARPCQYTKMELNPTCTFLDWTDKRCSLEHAEALNEVIRSISHNNPCSLIGFSGGGAIAILIAKINSLVTDIVTIAANLDIRAFSQYHGVPGHRTSLNPVDYAKSLNHIPQLHLAGARDTVVPSFIIDGFVRASQPSNCVKFMLLPNVTHNKGWSAFWPKILESLPTCNGSPGASK